MSHQRFARHLILDTAVAVLALALLAPLAHARYDRAFTLKPGYHLNWPRSVRPALRLAQRVWHPACNGPLGPNRLVLNVIPVPAYLRNTGDFVGSIAGWAEQGDCRINLPQGARLLGGPDLCELVLHETGHVAGFHEAGGPDDGGHSANPNNIMYPGSFVLKGTGHIAGMRGTFYSWYGVDRRCMRAYDEPTSGASLSQRRAG